MTQSFDDFKSHVIKTARDVFVEFGRVNTTACLLVNKNPETGEQLSDSRILAVACPDFIDNESKNTLIDYLKKLCVSLEVSAVAVIMEAWLSTDLGVQPSLDPKRQEVIVISIESPYSQEIHIADITRQPDGTGIMSDFKVTQQCSGRFTGFLYNPSLN